MMAISPGWGTTPPLHLVGSSQLPPVLLIQVRNAAVGWTHSENSEVSFVPLWVAVAVTNRPLPPNMNGQRRAALRVGGDGLRAEQDLTLAMAGGIAGRAAEILDAIGRVGTAVEDSVDAAGCAR